MHWSNSIVYFFQNKTLLDFSLAYLFIITCLHQLSQQGCYFSNIVELCGIHFNRIGWAKKVRLDRENRLSNAYNTIRSDHIERIGNEQDQPEREIWTVLRALETENYR